MAGHSDDALSSLSWLVGLNSASCLTQLDADNAPGRRCRQGSWKKAPASNRAVPYTTSLPQYWATGGDDTHTAQGDELPAERPSLSFTCLIGLAILRSKDQKAAVGSIYQFIHANFPYFRQAKATWRNSIRHVLSLGKFFFKVRSSGGGGSGSRKKAPKPGNMWCIKAGAHATLLKLIEQAQKELSPKFVRHLSLHNLQSIRLKVHHPPPACKPEAPCTAPLPPAHDHDGMLLDLASLPDFEGASSAAPRVPDCVHDLDLAASMDSLLDLGCYAHQVDCASSALQLHGSMAEGCGLESLCYDGAGVTGCDQGYDSHDSDCEVMSLTSSTGSTMSSYSSYSSYSDVGVDVCDMSFCDQVRWPAVPTPDDATDDATVPSWPF